MQPTTSPTSAAQKPLHLRPPRAADADAIYQACQDPLVQKWTVALPVPYTRADAESFVGVISPAGWADGSEYAWVIEDPQSQGLLGVIGLKGLTEGGREVGYWLAPGARGRGVATQALSDVCRFGFDILRLRVVHWRAIAGNEPSRRVAERVGFQVSDPIRGLLAQRGRWVDGWAATLLPADEPMPEPVALTDGVVVLRPWRGSDLDGFADLVDDDVVRWTSVSGREPEALTRWLDRHLRPQRAPDGRFALTDARQRLLGGVDLRRDPVTGTIALGWWLGPTHRGQGLAVRAVRLAIDWAGGFAPPRFVAEILGGNTASTALAERLGLRCEGLQRVHWPATAGSDARQDTWLYSLVPGDPGWPSG